MKKFLIFSVISLLTLGSCSKQDFDFNQQEIKEEKFLSDFNATFGVTADAYANHKWGMDIIPLVEVSTTRAAQPNGNQWGTHDDNDKYFNYPKPKAITTDEYNKVMAVFNEKGAESYEPLVHWKNFFVQQVHTGANGIKMNELATTVDYTVETNVISWWPYKAETTVNNVAPFDDIINNFNAGNCTAWDGCMLMWNSATDDFSFKTSQSGGERIYKHWRMECIDGNYYVGFDHEAWRQAPANANEEDKRDYYYNDWIIKIVPGVGEIIPQPVDRVRIMCEDLGSATSDFDYNDIVFDIKFIKDGSKYKADIIIQAAGGTIPLTIGGSEVHSLFGVNVTDMVNTGAGPNRDPVKITVDLKGTNYANAWEAINDLPIVVQYNGTPIQLTTNPGSPAEMIAVPTSTNWSGERVSIKNTYPAFAQWISDSSVKWWE